ncbi:MAG: ArgE/DapE family deacylase [Candidatus Latescibacteria bacterium]|jgi:acetylornithine deacetylase|nr:ArgE/DapE family deacylase [Candidatus Latescibacterota bacterium]
MVAIDEQETVELLKELIRIDSVNPDLVPDGAGEAAIGEFVRAYMADSGLEVVVQDSAPGRPNVIGTLRSANPVSGKSLMLNGHTDTVGFGKMDIDPLDPVERGGRIYGRGSADMKSGVAAMLSATAAVVRSGIRLSGDVIVAAVVDEEYASIGTETLVKDFGADAAIVTEPTNLSLTVAHKGFAWIEITTRGRSAHGSDSSSGRDAIMMMAEVLQSFRQHDQSQLATRNHPILSPPSLHASIIEGGKELSTYPDTCRLQLERRTVPGETQASIEVEIADILDGCRLRDADFSAESAVLFYREPLEIDRSDSVVKALHASFQDVAGRSPEYTGSAGWMDSGILCASGIPTVVFGPSGDGFHGAVESVDRDSVVQCAQILANTIVSFCA